MPGTYPVQLHPDSLPEELNASFDRDGNPDPNTLVTLVNGLSILDANFGFQVSEDLPVTGFEMQAFLILGLIFTLLGAVLVTTTRTRRRPMRPDRTDGLRQVPSVPSYWGRGI